MSATIVTSSTHTPIGQGTSAHNSAHSRGSAAQPSSTVALESLSGFVNKPARGWLHPDHLFAKDGINYNVRVRYISGGYVYI